MSADREQIVRRAIEAFAARDLDVLIEIVDPGIELRPLVSVWQRTFHGIDGLEEWFREVERTWDAFEIGEVAVREVDADRMLASSNWRGRAIAGGSEVGGPVAGLITFRGDKVTIADFFLSEEAALASLDASG